MKSGEGGGGGEEEAEVNCERGKRELMFPM